MTEPENAANTDPAVVAAKNSEKVGLPTNVGMQVRNTLRKFPLLKQVIKDGFDYEGFCKAVDVSENLTAEGKALAKDLFNPNKRVSAAFMRGGKQASDAYKEKFLGSTETAADHPIHATWRDVWENTKGRFSKEVSAYETMVAKKNEKRGKTIAADEPQYPHAVPQIIQSKAKGASVGMLLVGDNPSLIISEGFLQLPPEQQKAVLYHEARHGFEPVTTKVEVNKYALRRLAIQGLTLNASSRHHEHKADENAAAFGHAETLAKALEHMTESTMPMMKEMYGAMATVAKTATDHGFQIDKKKAVEILNNNQPQPTTFKQKMLMPVVKLGNRMSVSTFNEAIRGLASGDAQRLIEEAMNPKNPKLWHVVRVGTHPTAAERVQRLTGNGGGRGV